MARALQFLFGWILLVGGEFLKVYWIMPFSGSQQSDTIEAAYFLHNSILYIRIMAVLLMIIPAIYYFRYGNKKSKILVSIAIITGGTVFYLFKFKFAADKMFYQPEHKIFAAVSGNRVDGEKLVVGIHHNGIAKAYPIQFIGYHHQVRDSVGGMPVMVTYCTVCRTGRVFSPLVGGKEETFRLVGMDHFNAMFEDKTTGTWWRQVSGEAVAGPLIGQSLQEIPSEQMSLEAWVRRYPETLIMQADPTFQEEYDRMKSYDRGKGKSHLTGRDSLSWNEKSWILGVVIGEHSRAYDWNDVVRARVINDTLGKTPIVIAVEGDSASFHVWKRDTLKFSWNKDLAILEDKTTGSKWNWEGKSTDGPLKGCTLPSIQSYQEFWHSWRTFRPGTTGYRKPE